MSNYISTKRNLSLCLALMAALFICTACEPTETLLASADPAVAGSYSQCTYTSGLADSGYSSAQVFYPCEKAAGPFPATTLTGGFTNTKEQMYWLAQHLVTHGYIIIAITPTNVYGSAPTWETAHKAGINKLKSENGRSSSPIFGLVNTSKLQISGYSMGGGGTLLAAHDLGSQIASAQAFAPYGGGTTLAGIRAATICYAGGADTVATPSSVINSYNSLPNSIMRTYAEFSGVGHMDWISGSSTTRTKFKTYITSWMKVHLDGDASYSGYIDGHQSWFDEFAINVDVAGGGGGCN